jgi:hypothetical protein
LRPSRNRRASFSALRVEEIALSATLAEPLFDLLVLRRASAAG